ncbi:MAG: 4'-phosphopantetheinyl transferase superfamily protein [Chloroflexota bacterium]
MTTQSMTSPFAWQTNVFWTQPPGDGSYPALRGQDVHMWRIEIDQAKHHYDRFYALLAEDEKERAGRFYFEKDRRCYVTARGILRTLLGHYLQRAPAHIHFDYTDHGKPFVADSPIEFNISHSANMILAAFTHDRIIGVDVEYMRPTVECDDIVSHFFSAKEIATYRALPDGIRRLAFFECWTRKEACLKAWGSGLSYPLAKFDVTLAPDALPELQHVVDEPDEPRRWSMHRLECGEGYAGTVLIEKGRVEQVESSLICWQWLE